MFTIMFWNIATRFREALILGGVVSGALKLIVIFLLLFIAMLKAPVSKPVIFTLILCGVKQVILCVGVIVSQASISAVKKSRLLVEPFIVNSVTICVSMLPEASVVPLKMLNALESLITTCAFSNASVFKVLC